MEAVERNYSLSNDELAMMVGDFVVYMNRDSVQLAARGVTALNITEFEALGDIFEVFPPDGYYSALVSAQVEAKNDARNNSYNKIQLISGFFEQQWGLGSWQYRQMDIKKLSSFSDDKFLARGRNVVAVATEQLSNLTGIGLTQGDIDALEAELQIMEDKLHAIKEKQALRNSKTQERTEKGNELYFFLKKYSTIGKLVWENVDEAKYNDYIIYRKVNSGLPKAQNLVVETDPFAPTQANLSWSPVVGATDYELYSSQVPLGSPSAEFSLTNTVTTPSDTQNLISGFRYYYKVRGINAEQVGGFSDEVWIEV